MNHTKPRNPYSCKQRRNLARLHAMLGWLSWLAREGGVSVTRTELVLAAAYRQGQGLLSLQDARVPGMADKILNQISRTTSALLDQHFAEHGVLETRRERNRVVWEREHDQGFPDPWPRVPRDRDDVIDQARVAARNGVEHLHARLRQDPWFRAHEPRAKAAFLVKIIVAQAFSPFSDDELRRDRKLILFHTRQAAQDQARYCIRRSLSHAP